MYRKYFRLFLFADNTLEISKSLFMHVSTSSVPHCFAGWRFHLTNLTSPFLIYTYASMRLFKGRPTFSQKKGGGRGGFGCWLHYTVTCCVLCVLFMCNLGAKKWSEDHDDGMNKMMTFWGTGCWIWMKGNIVCLCGEEALFSVCVCAVYFRGWDDSYDQDDECAYLSCRCLAFSRWCCGEKDWGPRRETTVHKPHADFWGKEPIRRIGGIS